MWILFNFRPRTLPDFVRMCRLYGMTMADIRMQEGWAMAHWLQNTNGVTYVVDTNDTLCQILGWSDGGLTRCWTDDNVPGKTQAKILFNNALPSQHLIALAYLIDQNSANARVQAFRYHVSKLPFSHYFPQDGAESLAITYTPPKREKKSKVVEPQTGSQDEIVLEDALILEEMARDSERTSTQSVINLPEGAKINPMPPRGMVLLDTKLVEPEADVSVSWQTVRGIKTISIAAKSNSKKVCDIRVNSLTDAVFEIN